MNYSFLKKTSLFRGANEEEIESMLKCLGAYTKTFDKNIIIYHIGEVVDTIGLVLSGGVNIQVDDIGGNTSILNHIGTGQVFAETYAFIPNEHLLVNMETTEKTKVLFLNSNKILQTCTNCCAHHQKMIRNILQISVAKNLSLSRRILHTSPKTIRQRLLSYLSEQSIKNGSYEFTIPFNRQQLSEFLSVDRSAMSSELSKMQKDGLLTYEKNSFKLKPQMLVR